MFQTGNNLQQKKQSHAKLLFNMIQNTNNIVRLLCNLISSYKIALLSFEPEFKQYL